jgi:capsular exopolysaccharide synthesis family protein
MEKELIIDKDPKSPIAEVFRTLRTNIQFMTANNSLKTLLVTSSVPGEGKSWVSANLAIAFAGEGKKVVLIDADMRKGRLHTIFDIDNKPGLSNYLSGVSDLEEKDNIFNYIRKTNNDRLYVMPAGDVPPNPSELLVSEKTNELVEKLKENFDMVIFDGTPVLLVTDSLILARKLDSTIIVTAYKTTKMGDIEKIKKMIENVGGNISGIVINKIPVTAKKYEDTYYYGHREEKEDKAQEKIEDKKEEIHEEPQKEEQEPKEEN